MSGCVDGFPAGRTVHIGISAFGACSLDRLVSSFALIFNADLSWVQAYALDRKLNCKTYSTKPT